MSKLTRFLKDSRGLTLVEMLVGITLLSITMGILGSALFRALGTQSSVVDDGLAINELRKGLGWLAGDVKMATTTDLVLGAPATSTVTLEWKDQFADSDTTYVSTYSLSGDRLLRTLTVGTSTPESHTIARRVISAEFSLTATSTIVGQFQVDAAPEETRILSVKTVMRPDR